MSAVAAPRLSSPRIAVTAARSERSVWLPALAVALALEAALLAGLLWWSGHAPAPAPAAPVDIVLQPAPVPAVTLPPLPEPAQRPKPRPLVRTAPRPAPAPVAATPPPVPMPAAVPAPAPAPDTRPAMPVAAAAPTSGSERAAFEAQLRAAVQASVRYPAAARMMHLTGRTLVAFDYQDGVASGARVAQSSGSDELDQAALAAVRSATFPRPPKDLAGTTLRFDVWVRFHLQDEAD
jgi:protein TonB